MKKCLKRSEKVLNFAIKNISEKHLGCIIAIGDFSDLHNMLISTGGFCDDNIDELNQRWILTLKLIDGFVDNLIRNNGEFALHILKLFMNTLKEMISSYETHINQQKDEYVSK